jgi:hypothetical protein
MSRRVALLRTNVSDEGSTSTTRVERISKLGTTLIGTKNSNTHLTANVIPISLILFTLMVEAKSSSEMSVLTRATRGHTPEYVILQPVCMWNFVLVMDFEEVYFAS